VLHGLDDAITPVDDSRQLAAAMPSARLVEIPDGQHTTLFTEPAPRDICTRHVASLFASLG
jgi:pimeloyl-ACP methyl ester carboxylesterase